MLLLGPIDFLILRIKLFIPAQYGIKKWNWQYVERRRSEVPFGMHPQRGSVRLRISPCGICPRSGVGIPPDSYRDS